MITEAGINLFYCGFFFDFLAFAGCFTVGFAEDTLPEGLAGRELTVIPGDETERPLVSLGPKANLNTAPTAKGVTLSAVNTTF